MLEVKPFKGFRFHADTTGTLDKVITPPYDVITPDERAQLAAGSPFNMVHVILPTPGEGDGDRYANAEANLSRWISEKALRQDDTPSYYLLRQRFTDLEGRQHVRRAFYASVKLPEVGERYILGHERTFNKPVEDRLSLTRATRMSLGAVFVLYSDPERRLQAFLEQMETRPADLTAHTIDGVDQELWQVPACEEVAAFFPGKTLYIADGHHRFQTACTYRDEQRIAYGHKGLQAYDYALMGFVSFEDAGLKVYAAHRVVKAFEGFDEAAFLEKLGQWFTITPESGDIVEAVKSAEGDGVFGLVLPKNGALLIRFKGADRSDLLGTDRGPAWRDLDVALLHRGIFERILGMPEGAVYEYEKQAATALDWVARGDAAMAVLLKPTRADQICACAEAVEPMPQKSTYFFPKLPTGGVLYPLY